MRDDDSETGFSTHTEVHPVEWEKCAEMLDEAVRRIEAECFATEKSTLYLTRGPNFRDEIATVKKYKGTRKGSKPFHFANITAYMECMYDVVWADG